MFDFDVPLPKSLKGGLLIVVGNKRLAKILQDEFELLRDPERGGDLFYSVRRWAEDMDINHTTLGRALKGEKTGTSAFTVGKIGLYFREKYGVKKQMEVLRAAQVYLEEDEPEL